MIKSFLYLIFFVCLYIIVLGNMELAHDEAYYWMFAQKLDWGYFDHPPMVGWLIFLSSWINKSELFVRLPFLVMTILTPFLIYRTLKNEKFVFIVSLFLLFPMASIGGLLALPDGALIFFTSLYLLCLKEYLENDIPKWGISLSLTIAALFYSKYHSILLIILSLIAYPQFFKRRSFWLIVIFICVLMTPHLFWQIQHDFITFKYHFLMRPKANFSSKSFIEFLIIHLFMPGLLLGPFVWLKLIKSKTDNPFDRILKMIGLGIVIFFFVSLFSKKFEANWTINLSVVFIILISRLNLIQEKLKKVIFFQVVIILIGLVIFSVNKDLMGKRLGEFRGWREFSKKIQESTPDCFLLANTYQVSSKLNFYADFGYPIWSLNLGSRPNQYDIWGQEALGGHQKYCYLTQKPFLNSHKFILPTGKTIYLVRNFNFGDKIGKEKEEDGIK